MSIYKRLADTTETEKAILRDHFLERIFELETELERATKLSKVKDIEKLLQCNKRYLSWISEAPSDTLH